MRLTTTLAAAAALATMASSALAWDDAYKGDGTNDPNSNFLVHSYNAPNHCPSGLQPVMMGGVICCGEPNAGAYIDRPGKAYKPRHARHAPRAYAPVGEKGVVYR